MPLPVRMLLAAIVVLLALGLLGFLFWTGIQRESLPVIWIAGGLLACLVLFFFCKLRKFRRRRSFGKEKA